MSGRELVVEVDGGSRGNPGPAGYGALVRDATSGDILTERAGGIGTATNNVAEYRGLIAGLRAAAEIDPAASVQVLADSKLVVEQMSGRWQVKDAKIRPLVAEAQQAAAGFAQVRFGWVPRAKNAAADRLANQAMDAQAAGRSWAPSDAALADAGPSGAAAAKPSGSGWSASRSPATVTILVRHGQTPLSIDRRFSGLGNPQLTETGRGQAAAVARRLAGTDVDLIISSPLSRARETAAAIGAAGKREVLVEDGLREVDFGRWEGLTFAQIQQDWPKELEAWLADTSVPPPGGESFADADARVQQALERLQTAHAGHTLVLVSHVTPIKCLVRQALGAPLEALYRMYLDLAAVSIVDWYADGPSVLRTFNDTAHLAG